VVDENKLKEIMNFSLHLLAKGIICSFLAAILITEGLNLNIGIISGLLMVYLCFQVIMSFINFLHKDKISEYEKFMKESRDREE